MLPTLSVEFVRDYDLSRNAHIDRSARTVRLSDVNYETSHAALEELIKRMQKLAAAKRPPTPILRKTTMVASSSGPI